VITCPFGVIDRQPDDGRAFKCTFCYDRQKAGLKPACATACPTDSIKFGEIDDLRRQADARIEALHAKGMADATLYDPRDSSVGGIHALFIVRGDPAAYNLPPRPEVPTVYLRPAWTSAFTMAAAMLAGALLAFAGRRP
jgi:formate dehydrogenase iron-sulfur subunit